MEKMTNNDMLKVAAETAVKQGVEGVAPVLKTAITKGITTSEFKMAAIGLGLSVVYGFATALSLIPGPSSIIGAGILGGFSVFGYTVSRGLAKSNAVPSITVKQHQ